MHSQQNSQMHVEVNVPVAGEQSAATVSAPVGFNTGGDYYTKEEMQQFQAPKQKKVLCFSSLIYYQ